MTDHVIPFRSKHGPFPRAVPDATPKESFFSRLVGIGATPEKARGLFLTRQKFALDNMAKETAENTDLMAWIELLNEALNIAYHAQAEGK